MVHDICGHELRIAARDARPAERHYRLRDIHVDHDPPPEPARRGIRDSLEIVLCRQAAKGAIDEFAGRFLVDVADDRDFHLVTREDATHIVAQIIDRDPRHRLQSALCLTPVRMTGKRRLPSAASWTYIVF